MGSILSDLLDACPQLIELNLAQTVHSDEKLWRHEQLQSLQFLNLNCVSSTSADFTANLMELAEEPTALRGLLLDACHTMDAEACTQVLRLLQQQRSLRYVELPSVTNCVGDMELLVTARQAIFQYVRHEYLSHEMQIAFLMVLRRLSMDSLDQHIVRRIFQFTGRTHPPMVVENNTVRLLNAL
jgi:hypothetical protein